jgi:hypothetical protein
MVGIFVRLRRKGPPLEMQRQGVLQSLNIASRISVRLTRKVDTEISRIQDAQLGGVPQCDHSHLKISVLEMQIKRRKCKNSECGARECIGIGQ